MNDNVPQPMAWLGRIGLAARGVVYLLVGGLTIMAGAGLRGGKVGDQRQAIAFLASSFGVTALWLVGGGLAAFVIWRVAQVLLTKKWSTRFLSFVSAAAYSSIVITILTQAFSGRNQGGGSGEKGIRENIAWLLSQPLGGWITIALGGAVLGAAFYQFSRAIHAGFAKHLHGGRFSAEQERWACRVGRAGFAARGIAFGLIGTFLIQAGLQNDAKEAGGLAAVLQTLAAQEGGPVLLTIVGAGLAAFGIWSLVEARCRTQFA